MGKRLYAFRGQNYMNALTKLGLTTMALFSWLYGKNSQTLFISPKLNVQVYQEHLQADPHAKPYFLFDIHHVLFEHQKNPYISSFAKIKNKPKFIWQAVKTTVSPSFWKRFQTLQKQNIKVTEAYIHELQHRPKLYNNLCQFMTDLYVPNKKMQKKVTALKNAGHELYLLSNIGPELLRMLQRDYPDFFTIFNRPTNTINYAITDNHVWLSKPHVSSYQHALEVTGHTNEPWLGIFIDDKPENIKGALEAGLNGILFTSAEQFEQDTQTLFTLIKDFKRGTKTATCDHIQL